MDGGSVAELVARRAADDNLALIYGEERWTWREVVAESGRRAQWLRSVLDSGRPQNVGVLLPNTPDYVLSLFAAALAGACVVGLNSTRRSAELARDIAHTQCQLVLSDRAGASRVDEVTLVEDTPWEGFDNGLPDQLPSPEALLLLIFTSGSTSAPKAVRRTSGRIASTAQIGFTSDDVLYCAMPLAHGNALFSNLFPGLAAGATIVLRDQFSASSWINDVRRHHVTFANTVGRALGYVLATAPAETDVDHRLRVVLAPEASPRDVAAFKERFHTKVISGYGQSEAGISLFPVNREGALGLAPPGADIAVVDSTTGEECAPADFDEGGLLLNPKAAVGELVRRDSTAGFEGYWGNPEAQEERLRNGWYWSGDLAYRDAQGVFFFAGRVGDWLRVDAENFAAAPVERVIARHPGLAAVAVVGVPDPQSGDQVLAAVELEPGASLEVEDLRRWLAEQPDFGRKWLPRFVRVCDRIPTTGNEKVNRVLVKDQAWLTTDPVWWRPGREPNFRLLTQEDCAAIRDEFVRHRRADSHPAELAHG